MAIPLAVSVPLPERYDEYCSVVAVIQQLGHKHVSAGEPQGVV